MLHAPPIHHSIDGAVACKAPARALQKVARVVAEKESTGRHVLLRASSDHGGRSDHRMGADGGDGVDILSRYEHFNTGSV